jgi:arylsulfatase A-like enzyme
MFTLVNNKIYSSEIKYRFTLILSAIFFIFLILIRLNKVFFSIFNFNFNIFSLTNITFIFLSFFQDILLFIIILFTVNFFIKKINNKFLIVIEIILCFLYYLVFIYNTVDLLYFKSSTSSLSWINISQLDNISNLFDSGLSYMTPFLFVLLLLSIFSFFILPFILTNISENKNISIKFKIIELPKNVIFICIVILMFFSSQYFISCINLSVEINANPLLKLITSFAAELNSSNKIKSEAISNTNTFKIDNKILTSVNTPISITDRKTQGLIKTKLSKIKNRNFNVIYYLTESTFAGYYPMYGSKIDPSPFLQEKSLNSLLMKNMYSTGVRSINSLISILTGLNGYPGYKSMTFINPEIKAKSLSEILKTIGYSNALIHSGSFDFYSKLLFLKNRDYDFLIDENYFKKKYPGIFYSSWGIDDRVATNEGLKWIDEQVKNNKNFFLTYVPILPHHPYTLPPDSDLFIKNPKTLFDNYLNSLYFVDSNLKILFTGLEKRNLLDDTIIVFLADHGEAFGQHSGNFGHENNIYEENVRIPGIIFNKKLFDQTYEFDGITTNSDMYATILDLLNIEIPVGCQGESVLKMNTGKIAFFASDEKNIDIGLRDGNYKAIYSMNENTLKLYDISKSNIDTNDISNKEPELSRDYKRILSEYFKYQKNYLENFNEIILKSQKDKNDNMSVSLLDLKPFFKSQDFFPIQKNITADESKPFVIKGKTYSTGYGVFANSCMKFNIKNAGYTKFKGLAGKIDNWSTRENYLEMQILTDGKKIFSTGLLNYGDDPVNFDLDLPTDTENLELLILDGGDNQSMDSAAWINPVLY